MLSFTKKNALISDESFESLSIQLINRIYIIPRISYEFPQTKIACFDSAPLNCSAGMYVEESRTRRCRGYSNLLNVHSLINGVIFNGGMGKRWKLPFSLFISDLIDTAVRLR